MDDTPSARSKLIASLLGPVLMAVSGSEALHLDIWSQGLPQLVYLNGLILFALGLAIIRVHNRWHLAWPLAITIIGWMMLAAGLFRMFFPRAEQADATPLTYAFVSLIFLLGAFLTLKAYRS